MRFRFQPEQEKVEVCVCVCGREEEQKACNLTEIQGLDGSGKRRREEILRKGQTEER